MKEKREKYQGKRGWWLGAKDLFMYLKLPKPARLRKTKPNKIRNCRMWRFLTTE